jgi:pyruvate kinase
MKLTKIVATIGPVSEEIEILKKLAEAGVNVFRLNFSHGDHAWHKKVISRIKKLNKELPQKVAIMLDTKGPEIRTGDLVSPIFLKKNQKIILTVEKEFNPSQKVSVNYDGFIDDVRVGEKILVDNGVMNFHVLEKKGKDVICEVIDGGELGSRRHLNLPGREISLEAITKKDWKDIEFGVEMGVDFIALSFVRNGDEVLECKRFLVNKKSKIEVISKIESFEATKNLEKIISVSDGTMVARGDLGAEIPFSQVPKMQQAIIDLCSKFRKPVIVATNMLESMTKNPIPTRAETTDVFTAVMQRSDAVMLSGETAGGKFPLKSVEVMTEIIQETEKDFLERKMQKSFKIDSDRIGFAKVAAEMAVDIIGINGIIVITRSGETALMVSSFRSNIPIFAFTNSSSSRRKMALIWGVSAFEIAFSKDSEKTVERAYVEFCKNYPEVQGGKFVLVSDSLVDGKFIPMVQIREF